MSKFDKVKSFIFSKGTEYAKDAAKGFVAKICLTVLAIVIVINVVFKAYDYGIARYECHTAWVESGIDYKYTLRGGCLLKRGEYWIPAKNFRVD